MWTALLGLIKSPKIIIGVIATVVIVGGGWYVSNTLQEKGRLESQLSDVQSDLVNTKATLQEERERFSQRIANYEELISNYTDSVQGSNEENSKLRSEIDHLKKENDQLQECFDTELPESVLDMIFERGGDKR